MASTQYVGASPGHPILPQIRAGSWRTANRERPLTPDRDPDVLRTLLMPAGLHPFSTPSPKARNGEPVGGRHSVLKPLMWGALGARLGLLPPEEGRPTRGPGPGGGKLAEKGGKAARDRAGAQAGMGLCWPGAGLSPANPSLSSISSGGRPPVRRRPLTGPRGHPGQRRTQTRMLLFTRLCLRISKTFSRHNH